MKVGDYVRTIKGIGKIEKIETDKQDTIVYLDSGITIDYITKDFTKEEIKKMYPSSPNIIDLIEVGDFVNREYVLEITKKEKTPGFKRYFVTWRSAIYGERIDEYELKRILETIVTKEQFEAMEYKCE